MKTIPTTTDPRAVFAEEMPAFGPDAKLYSGPEAEAVLDDLLGEKPAQEGAEEVTRRLRGRPRLDPHAPHGTEVKIYARIDTRLDRLVKAYLRSPKPAAKNQSDLVRTALTEYFHNHNISTDA